MLSAVIASRWSAHQEEIKKKWNPTEQHLRSLSNGNGVRNGMALWGRRHRSSSSPVIPGRDSGALPRAEPRCGRAWGGLSRCSAEHITPADTPSPVERHVALEENLPRTDQDMGQFDQDAGDEAMGEDDMRRPCVRAGEHTQRDAYNPLEV